MRKLFLLLIIFSVALGGCGDVEWFPEQGVSQFSFDPDTVTDVAPGDTVTSNAIEVRTTTGSEAISVDVGEYSINGAAFTTAAGKVVDGDQVTVRHQAADVAGETVTTTLKIGDKRATFSSVAGAPFEFEEALRVGVVPGSEQLSSTIQVAISDSSAPISVTGGDYRIERSGQAAGAWTSSPGTVNRGDRVTVRHTAAAGTEGDTTVVTVLTVGNREAIFATSTTAIPTEVVEVRTSGQEPLIVELRSLLSGTFTLDVVESDALAEISLEREGVYRDTPIEATLDVGQIIYFKETVFPTSATDVDTTVIWITDADGAVVQEIVVNVRLQ